MPPHEQLTRLANASNGLASRMAETLGTKILGLESSASVLDSEHKETRVAGSGSANNHGLAEL